MISRMAVVGACEWANKIRGPEMNGGKGRCKAHFWMRPIDYFTNEVLCLLFSQELRNF